MIELSDSSLQRTLCARRAVTVDKHIGSVICSSSHSGLNFFEEEFVDVERIVERCNTTADRHLDLSSSQKEGVARCLDDLVYSVTKLGKPKDFPDIQWATPVVGKTIDVSEVSMATILRKHRARAVNARTHSVAILDGLMDSKDVASGVTNGRDAAIDEPLALGDGNASHIRWGLVKNLLGGEAQHGVPVGIDETGSEVASFAVDDLLVPSLGTRGGDETFDSVSLEYNIHVGDELFTFAVKDTTEILDEHSMVVGHSRRHQEGVAHTEGSTFLQVCHSGLGEGDEKRKIGLRAGR
mmetsp:Transcript_26511/g.66452  ORF Transcript_26511/g.66452 Transcript_26511/m.66452 type:complete len:296 (+) Transcript_26511:763-1650(+)